MLTCDACRFDSRLWSASDLRRTLDAVGVFAAHLAEGAPAPVLEALAPMVAALPRSNRDPDAGPDAEAVHRAWHLLADMGRLRHALGAGAPTRTGEVVQVSTSPGGVPKMPVQRAAVGVRGLVGDRQANRTHHGRPWQAVCLWSAEVVDALAADGHPIGYGAAGENVTLRGLDWPALRPGTRLLVGTALLELTAYAIPCQKNARWFSDRRFRRMAHEVSPGSSRLYARVVVDGVVTVGDPAVVEPAAVPSQAVPPRQLALEV